MVSGAVSNTSILLTTTYELYGRKGTLIPVPFALVIRDAVIAMAVETTRHSAVNSNTMSSCPGLLAPKGNNLFNAFNHIFHPSRFVTSLFSSDQCHIYDISKECPFMFSLIDRPPTVANGGIANDEDICAILDSGDGLIQVLGGDTDRDPPSEYGLPIDISAAVEGHDPLRDDTGDLFLGATASGSSIVSDTSSSSGVSSLRFSDGNGIISFAQDSFVGPPTPTTRDTDGGKSKLDTAPESKTTVRICVILHAVSVGTPHTTESVFTVLDGVDSVEGQGDVYCFDSEGISDDKSIGSSSSHADNIYYVDNDILSPIFILCNDSSVGDAYVASANNAGAETAVYIHSIIVDKIRIQMCRKTARSIRDNHISTEMDTTSSLPFAVPIDSSLSQSTLRLSVTFFFVPLFPSSFPLNTARYRSGRHYDKMALGTWGSTFISQTSNTTGEHPSQGYTYTTAAININVVNTPPVAIYSLLQLRIDETLQSHSDDDSDKLSVNDSRKDSVGVRNMWCQISLLLPVSFEHFRAYDADYQLGRNDEELRYITLLAPWLDDSGHSKDNGKRNREGMNMDKESETTSQNGDHMPRTVAYVHMRHYIQPLEEYGNNANRYNISTGADGDVVSSPLWFSPPPYSVNDDNVADTGTEGEADDVKKIDSSRLEKIAHYSVFLPPISSSPVHDGSGSHSIEKLQRHHQSSLEPYNVTVLYTVQSSIEQGACVGNGPTVTLLSPTGNTRKAQVSLQFLHPFYTEYQEGDEEEFDEPYHYNSSYPPFPTNYEVQGCPTTTLDRTEGSSTATEGGLNTINSKTTRQEIKRIPICHFQKKLSNLRRIGDDREEDLYSENLRLRIKVEIVNVIHARSGHSVFSLSNQPNIPECNREETIQKTNNLPSNTTLISIPLHYSSILKLHLPYIPWDSEGATSKVTGITTIEAPLLELVVRIIASGVEPIVSDISGSTNENGETEISDKEGPSVYSMYMIEGVRFAPISTRKADNVTIRNNKSMNTVRTEKMNNNTVSTASKKHTIDTFSPHDADNSAEGPLPYLQTQINYDASIHHVYPTRVRVVSRLQRSDVYIPPFPPPRMQPTEVTEYHNDNIEGGYWEVREISGSYGGGEGFGVESDVGRQSIEKGYYIHSVSGQIVKIGDKIHVGSTGCYQENEINEISQQKRPTHRNAGSTTYTSDDLADVPVPLDPVHQSLEWVGNDIETISRKNLKKDNYIRPYKTVNDQVIMRTLNEASRKLHCSDTVSKSLRKENTSSNQDEEDYVTDHIPLKRLPQNSNKLSPAALYLYCDRLIPAINRTLSYPIYQSDSYHVPKHVSVGGFIHYNITFVYIPHSCGSRFTSPQHTVVLHPPLLRQQSPVCPTPTCPPSPLHIVHEVFYDVPHIPSLHYAQKGLFSNSLLEGSHFQVPITIPYSTTPSLYTVSQLGDKYVNENGEFDERLRFLDDVANAANVSSKLSSEDVDPEGYTIGQHELIRRLLKQRRMHDSVGSNNTSGTADILSSSIDGCNDMLNRYEIRHIVGSGGDHRIRSLRLGAAVTVPSYNGGYRLRGRQKGSYPLLVASIGLSRTGLDTSDKVALMTECELLRAMLADKPRREALLSHPPHQLFVKLSFSPFPNSTTAANETYSSHSDQLHRLHRQRSCIRSGIFSFLSERRGAKEPIIVDMEVIDHYNGSSANPSTTSSISPNIVLIVRYKLIPIAHIEGSVRPMVRVVPIDTVGHISPTPSSAIVRHSDSITYLSRQLLSSQESDISPVVSDVVILNMRDSNGGLSSLPEVLVDVMNNLRKVVLRKHGSDIPNESQLLATSSSVVGRRFTPQMTEVSTGSSNSATFPSSVFVPLSQPSDEHYSNAPLSTIVLLPDGSDSLLKDHTKDAIVPFSETATSHLRRPIFEISTVKLVISDEASVELVRSSTEVVHASLCRTKKCSCGVSNDHRYTSGQVTCRISLSPQLFTLRSVGESDIDMYTDICNQMLVNKVTTGHSLPRYYIKAAFYADIRTSTLPTQAPTVDEVFGIVKFYYRHDSTHESHRLPLCRLAVQRSIPANDDDSVQLPQYTTSIMSAVVSPPLLTLNAISDPILVVFQEHVLEGQTSTTYHWGTRVLSALVVIITTLVVGFSVFVVMRRSHPLETEAHTNDVVFDSEEPIADEDNECVKGNSANHATNVSAEIKNSNRCVTYTETTSSIVLLTSQGERETRNDEMENNLDNNDYNNKDNTSIFTNGLINNIMKGLMFVRTILSERMKKNRWKCNNRLSANEVDNESDDEEMLMTEVIKAQC